MSKQRKSYSAAFKAKVALAAQRQDKTISQVKVKSNRVRQQETLKTGAARSIRNGVTPRVKVVHC